MLSYHPTSKTTYKIRQEIKENRDGLSVLEQAKKYNVSDKTIQKWRSRESFEDAPHGPKKAKKSISDLEEHIICEIRKTALLPLDDLLEVTKQLGIKITRSALDRALARNGISNLRKYIADLEPKEEVSSNNNFKDYEPGFVHVDIKYLPKIDGERQYLFVAIDRATRYVFVDIFPDKTAESANKFLQSLTTYFPFKITKILTDNGKEFTDRFNNKSKKPTGKHIFDKTCAAENILHRLTAPYTPKTNGMVERVNGKVSENVLNKIKFKTVAAMKACIFQYIYNYNHYIKHSSIDRKTPLEKLTEWSEDKLDKRRSLDKLKIEDEKILKNYRLGRDT